MFVITVIVVKGEATYSWAPKRFYPRNKHRGHTYMALAKREGFTKLQTSLDDAVGEGVRQLRCHRRGGLKI